MPDPIDFVMGLGVCAALVAVVCWNLPPRGNCPRCDGLGYRMHGIDGCGHCGGSGNVEVVMEHHGSPTAAYQNVAQVFTPDSDTQVDFVVTSRPRNLWVPNVNAEPPEQ